MNIYVAVDSLWSYILNDLVTSMVPDVDHYAYEIVNATVCETILITINHVKGHLSEEEYQHRLEMLKLSLTSEYPLMAIMNNALQITALLLTVLTAYPNKIQRILPKADDGHEVSGFFISYEI